MASAPCFAFEPYSQDECIDRLSEFGVLILGGGINSAGVARELALRAETSRVSLRITLVEQNHLASGTSPSTGQSIISSYSALRPLMQAAGKSPTAASRDHRIWVDHAALGCACEQSSAEIDLVLRVSGGVPA